MERKAAFSLSSFVFRRGEPMIWLAGAGVAVCLAMILGLLVLVMVKGMGFFWPRPLVLIEAKDGKKFLVEVLEREPNPDRKGTFRIRTKIANRDLNGLDFKWFEESEIAKRSVPLDAVLLERLEYGSFHGFLKELKQGSESFGIGSGAVPALVLLQARLHQGLLSLREQEKREVGAINTALERERLNVRKAELQAAPDLAVKKSQSEAHTAELTRRYEELATRLRRARDENGVAKAVFVDADGREKELAVRDLTRVILPNRLTWGQKAGIYLSRVREFLLDEPRESNTEGGVFPAIFGTVLMVLMMTVAVVPFGVIAALYLREYAKQGRLVQIVRIAVSDLAGVPSIVFGVFGLGFFVYSIGGRIDQLFYPEALPTPTFGTGGILWCALTLALLTVPVVVVATEEALAAVPRGMREASYALGATKWQTMWNVVLPSATPGILTGLILAIARGTGEVAPLMIIGVVKLAPNLPLDGVAPYLHLERKIMHLGFHIYDVGFQSPNVEAALPMVYMTTLLLVVIIVALNLTAILVRNRLRRNLQSAAF